MDMLTTFDLFDAPTGRNALYIAAKAPRPGLAKTRLARGIGQRTAIDLYRAFLRDLGARFAAPAARGAFSLGWYITPRTPGTTSRRWCRPGVCAMTRATGHASSHKDPATGRPGRKRSSRGPGNAARSAPS